jgi:hypothetical protein
VIALFLASVRAAHRLEDARPLADAACNAPTRAAALAGDPGDTEMGRRMWDYGCNHGIGHGLGAVASAGLLASAATAHTQCTHSALQSAPSPHRGVCTVCDCSSDAAVELCDALSASEWSFSCRGGVLMQIAVRNLSFEHPALGTAATAIRTEGLATAELCHC